jgi:hypothetical protein
MIGQNERCWQLYESSADQYLLGDLGSPIGHLEPVALSQAPDATRYF